MHACTHARARTHACTHVALLPLAQTILARILAMFRKQFVPTVFASDGPGVCVMRFAFLPAAGRAGMARKALWITQAGAAAILYRVYGTSLQ